MSYSLPGSDDILRTELYNGVVILCRENFNSPSIIINGYLPVGSLFDPVDQLGLASFTASALLRGTTHRRFQEIYDLLESAGASFHFEGGTHTTTFAGQALAEDFELLLEILSDGLCNPIFPPEEVDRLRSHILAGLAIRSQDTAYMAELTFDEIIYQDHPYSRPEEGFVETVQRIAAEDLVKFHQRTYGPRGLVIAVVGAVDANQVVEQISKVIASWYKPEQPLQPELPEVKRLKEQTTRKVFIPGKVQADLVLGAAGPKRCSPDFVAANIGNNVLGQFGMMGRIGDAVREKASLAYYAGSSLSGGLGPGPWEVTAGVEPQDVDRTVDLIMAEIQRFVSEPVSDEELSDSKSQFKGSLPLSLESNYGVSSALINLERYQLGLDYYRNYERMIDAVTKEDILQAAGRYLDPDTLGIAVAGPQAG